MGMGFEIAAMIVCYLAGGATVYAVLRNNIKGLKEREQELLTDLENEKAKKKALIDKLIEKKNEIVGG